VTHPDPNRQSPVTTLPNAGLTISRIGLGYAHTHLMDAATRAALVRRALDLGITHFDTARLYSDGLSEKTLGEVLARHRASVTITSKFGLMPTPFIGSAGRAAMPLRKGRSLLNKIGVVPYPRRSYSAATMRKSLHASLRALATDYIDIYQVHEPTPDTHLSDELIAELQRAKAAGTVRAIGVSGADVAATVDRYRDVIDVIQTAEGSWGGVSWVPDITHSLFSGDAVNAPLSGDTARRLLTAALDRRPQGTVIVQTSSPDRLSQIVEFANDPTR
jgi:aryl-alcohol dehydrogenase-like predicted oxidoreductase